MGRMRTVFDTEDQSMMARFENQKALNAYMDEMPFGIGMGAIDGVVPPLSLIHIYPDRSHSRP